MRRLGLPNHETHDKQDEKSKQDLQGQQLLRDHLNPLEILARKLMATENVDGATLRQSIEEAAGHRGTGPLSAALPSAEGVSSPSISGPNHAE